MKRAAYVALALALVSATTLLSTQADASAHGLGRTVVQAGDLDVASYESHRLLRTDADAKSTGSGSKATTTSKEAADAGDAMTKSKKEAGVASDATTKTAKEATTAPTAVTPKDKNEKTPTPTAEEKTPKPTEEEKTPKPTEEKTPKPTEEKTPKPAEEKTLKPTEEKTPKPTTEEKTPTPTEEKTPKPTEEEKTPKPTEEKTPKPTEEEKTPKPTEEKTPKPTTEKKTPKPTSDPSEDKDEKTLKPAETPAPSAESPGSGKAEDKAITKPTEIPTPAFQDKQEATPKPTSSAVPVATPTPSAVVPTPSETGATSKPTEIPAAPAPVSIAPISPEPVGNEATPEPTEALATLAPVSTAPISPEPIENAATSVPASIPATEAPVSVAPISPEPVENKATSVPTPSTATPIPSSAAPASVAPVDNPLAPVKNEATPTPDANDDGDDGDDEADDDSNQSPTPTPESSTPIKDNATTPAPVVVDNEADAPTAAETPAPTSATPNSGVDATSKTGSADDTDGESSDPAEPSTSSSAPPSTSNDAASDETDATTTPKPASGISILPIDLPALIPTRGPTAAPGAASSPPASDNSILPVDLTDLIPTSGPTSAPASVEPGAAATLKPATGDSILPVDLPDLIPSANGPTSTPTSTSGVSGGETGSTAKAPTVSTPTVSPASPLAGPSGSTSGGPLPVTETPTPTSKRPGFSIDWSVITDLFERKNSTTTPGAATAAGDAEDGAGKVVAPDLAADKVIASTNSSSKPSDAAAAANGFNLIRPANGKANTTESSSSNSSARGKATPVKKIEAKPHELGQKNKTVSVLEEEDDDETDEKATAFKVVEKSTITVKDGNKKKTYEKYDRNTNAEIVKRGKTSTILDTDDSGEVSTTDADSSTYGSVIGGNNRNHPPPGADIQVSAFAAKTQNAIRYSSYAFTLVSFGLLVFFHLLALKSPQWLAESASARRTGGSWFMPTTWELVAVMTYYQHLGSISMMELTKAPYIILDFTDSFSWVNFHLHSIVTANAAARRLQFIILTGIVSYSDRLGIDEGTVLASTTRFFLVLAGIVVAFFAIFAVARQVAFRKNHGGESEEDTAPKRAAWKDSFGVCVLGLGVALWLVSIYPLITVSTYELTMQIRYQVSGEIVVAMGNMWVVVVGMLCFLFYKVRSVRLNEAFQFTNHALYGTLYADMKQSFRYFFVGFVLFQVVIGVLTGGVQDVPDQLVALLIVHVIFCVVIVYLVPYADKRVNVFVILLNVVRIINLSISFAFLTVSEIETSTRGTIAHGFVVFNFVVILLLFVRHVGIFLVTLRQWSQYQSADDQSMLSQDFSNETPVVFGTNSRLSTLSSIQRGPNNSMHC